MIYLFIYYFFLLLFHIWMSPQKMDNGDITSQFGAMEYSSHRWWWIFRGIPGSARRQERQDGSAMMTWNDDGWLIYIYILEAPWKHHIFWMIRWLTMDDIPRLSRFWKPLRAVACSPKFQPPNCLLRRRLQIAEMMDATLNKKGPFYSGPHLTALWSEMHTAEWSSALGHGFSG